MMRTDDGDTRVVPDSAIDGEFTPLVRLVRLLIAVLVVAAIVAGLTRAVTGPESGTAAVVSGMVLTQVALAAILILLGSLVEGFGFGLSLGTHWPYTRNILVLTLRGDPEAAHRIVATLTGLIGVALVIVAPNSASISALALIVLTAVLGFGTLHVLSGRLPSFVHGFHGLLAYGVFLCYLTFLFGRQDVFWPYLGGTPALHALLLTVFLGGMTTGHRGFGQPIGAFDVPRRAPQWILIVHLLTALSVVATLGWLMPAYPVAFILAVAQFAIGFLLFHAVNLKPATPGILVAFHQVMALSIALAIVAA